MTTGWRGVRIAGLALAVVAGALAILTRDPIDVSPLAPPSGPGEAARSPAASNPETGPKVTAERGAFLERPLFERSRRPAPARATAPDPDAVGIDPAAEAVATVAPPPDPISEASPPRLRLLGTRRFAGETRALISGLDEPSQEPAWFGSGEVVQGWSIEAVTSRSVTLRLSQSTVDLHLHEAGR